MAAGQAAQRDHDGDGRVGDVGEVGRAAAQWLISCVALRPRSRSRSSSGAVTTRVCIWRCASARSLTALRRATRRVRSASTRPSRCLGVPVRVPASAARAAALGVDRVGLALPAAGLAVRPVDLDHGDAGLGEEPGQPGPVGAGALDPDL